MRINISTMLTVAGLWILSIGDACAQSEDGLARAGCPHQIARHARVGYGPQYVAYHVGGGAPVRKGEPRHFNEGTFGIDYQPIVPGFRRATALGWWHGQRQQGGAGQYEPNAPVTPFPNRRARSTAW